MQAWLAGAARHPPCSRLLLALPAPAYMLIPPCPHLVLGLGHALPPVLLAGMISSQLELHRYGTGRQSRIVTAMTLLKSHLFRYQVGVVVGGDVGVRG